MFIGILVYLLQMLNFGVLFHFLLGYQVQQNRVSRVCAILMIATGLTIQILYYDNMPPLLGIFFLIWIIVILPIIAFEGDWSRKLLLSLTYRCIYSVLYGFTEMLCNLFYMNAGSAVLLTMLEITLLLGMIVVCIKRKGLILNASVERINRGILFFLVTIIFFIDREIHVSLNESADALQLLVGYSQILSLVITMFFLAGAIFIHCIGEKNKELLYLNGLNQKYMEEQAKQYKNLEEKNLMLRRFRHDYKSHMTALQYYMKNAKYEAATSYLAELEEVENVTEYISTGNLIGDAVINQYAERGKNEQIEFDYHGRIPVMESVKETHFCALFSNAVCNAYEAALEAKGKKKITIRVAHRGGYLFVSVKNPIEYRLETYEGGLHTKKKDNNLHGFGTKNMKEIAEYYSGEVSWWETDGIVETKIRIKYTE